MKLLYRMIDGLPGLQRDVVQLRYGRTELSGCAKNFTGDGRTGESEFIPGQEKKLKHGFLNMENYGL